MDPETGNSVRVQEKSVELSCELIERFCDADGSVLDVFAGTAAFALGCMKTGRRFLGCEIDKRCFELASARLFNRFAEMYNKGLFNINNCY